MSGSAAASVESAQVFFKSPLRRLVLGSARVALEQPGTAALVPGRTARGVSVELTPRARALVLRAASAAKRFKYLSYRVRSGPQRLVVDLWKSAPPRAGTAARFGRRACLSVDVDSSQPGRLVVSGTVRRLFEATFVVRIRRADGRVIKRRIVTMQPGPWTQSIGYRVGSAQAGTVEAVALSAKGRVARLPRAATRRAAATLRRLRGVDGAPVVGDVDPAAEPHSVVGSHVIEQTPESNGAGRTPGEPVMKSDREQARLLGSLLVE